MSYVDTAAQWYVLQVRPKHEDLVSTHLRYKGYEEYSPSYHLATHSNNVRNRRAKKLFPGYVFCRFNYGEVGKVFDGHAVVTTPGVIKVLGGRTPIPVQLREITAIQCALASRLAPQPWPFLNTGMRVDIDAGPFRGISGIVVCGKGTHHLVLSIEVLQRSVAVTMPTDWLSPTVAIKEALTSARAKLGWNGHQYEESCQTRLK
jgi:transcription antitermination factor NusG